MAPQNPNPATMYRIFQIYHIDERALQDVQAAGYQPATTADIMRMMATQQNPRDHTELSARFNSMPRLYSRSVIAYSKEMLKISHNVPWNKLEIDGYAGFRPLEKGELMQIEGDSFTSEQLQETGSRLMYGEKAKSDPFLISLAEGDRTLLEKFIDANVTASKGKICDAGIRVYLPSYVREADPKEKLSGLSMYTERMRILSLGRTDDGTIFVGSSEGVPRVHEDLLGIREAPRSEHRLFYNFPEIREVEAHLRDLQPFLRSEALDPISKVVKQIVDFETSKEGTHSHLEDVVIAKHKLGELKGAMNPGIHGSIEKIIDGLLERYHIHPRQFLL